MQYILLLSLLAIYDRLNIVDVHYYNNTVILF